MNRDYVIDRATSMAFDSFYGSIMSKEQVEDVLMAFNIPKFDVNGNSRKIADLMKDLRRASIRVGSLSASRQIGDAIYSLYYYLVETTEPTQNKTSDKLDAFLETFKIVQGGVSL